MHKNAKVLHHEPDEVFRWFRHIASIPHGSGNEKALSDSLKSWADDRNLEVKQDELWNLLIKKAGQHGLENAPALILHGHTDIYIALNVGNLKRVCAKEDDSKHDFEKDALQLVLKDDDWIWASGTSLGADNGIGVSCILAMLESEDLPHPPIEAVLTVQEERGKVGGGAYNMGWLSAKRFIDLNWFQETDILVGNAGDLTAKIAVDCHWEKVPADWLTWKLIIDGATGGHCEMNIDAERANAIALLARVLRPLSDTIRICSARGGHQNSAIPTSAEIVFAMEPSSSSEVERVISNVGKTIRNEHKISDDKIILRTEDTERPESMSSAVDAKTFCALVTCLPNGVQSKSLEHQGLVECSSNLGLLWTEKEGLRLLSTITSLVMSRKHNVVDRMKALENIAPDQIKVECMWTDVPELLPLKASPLLDKASIAYEKTYQRKPHVLVASCSFEFGLFRKAIPDLDVICIGANMEELHSSKERFSISSVQRTWRFFKELVSTLS